MAKVEIKQDLQALAETAASAAVEILGQAIADRGQAVWVLAGGTAPLKAYQLIADRYIDRLDWQKVWFVIGDERCGPENHADANWLQIAHLLLEQLKLDPEHCLRPTYGVSAEVAAKHYVTMLAQLPKNSQGVPHFDHVWLGVGEDGHTLSLFSHHPSSNPTSQLVIPVHDSPKPPPDRISLTLEALTNTDSCLVMAAGTGKAAIMQQALNGNESLPIVQAVQTIEKTSGHVTWLLDTEAAAAVSR